MPSTDEAITFVGGRLYRRAGRGITGNGVRNRVTVSSAIYTYLDEAPQDAPGASETVSGYERAFVSL